MCRSRLTACLFVFLLLGACAPVSRPTLAPLVHRVMPAVVNISVESQAPDGKHPLFHDPTFRRFMKRSGLPLPRHLNTGRHRSVGSGFVIDAGRGYVLTNRHVVENARAITVTFKDGQNYRAQLVGSAARADIAVLRILQVPSGIKALRLGDSNALQVGDFVLALWQSLRHRPDGYVRNRERVGAPAGRQQRQQQSHTDRCLHQPRQLGRTAGGYGWASCGRQYGLARSQRGQCGHRLRNAGQSGAVRLAATDPCPELAHHPRQG